MPSSPSEPRRVLHLVVASALRSSALGDALTLCRPQDAVVLMQDAAIAAVRTVALPASVAQRLAKTRTFVLSADLAARGLATAPLRAGVDAIDYLDLVDLVAAHAVNQTWY